MKEIPDEFKCFVCYGAAYDARETECCGRHMCLFCSSGPKECPQCGMSPLVTQASHLVQHQLGQLHIYCTNRESWSRDCIMDYPRNPNTPDNPLPMRRPVIQGCDWSGEMNNLQKHLDHHCPHGRVTCRYQCGTQLRRCQQANHESKECRKRPFACWFCNLNGIAEMIDYHANRCHRRPVKCPNNCPAVLVQKDLDQHLQRCPLQVTPRECEMKILSQNYGQHHAAINTHTSLPQSSAKQSNKIASMGTGVKEQMECTCKPDKELNELIAHFKTEVGHKLRESETQITEQLKELNQQVANLKKQLEKNSQQILILSQLQLKGMVITVPYKTGVSASHYILGYCISIRINRGESAVKLVLQPGHYDEYLLWPVDGTITLLLLHYRESNEHKEMVYCLNKIRQPRIPIILTYTLSNISSLAPYAHGVTSKEYRLQVKNALL